MRELTCVEYGLVSGGADNCRDEYREMVVDVSLAVAPIWGSEIGMAYVAGMGLSYSIFAGIAGAYVGIVALPVVAKAGLELMFTMHDVLI